jgi:N-formylglutamate deformylase
MSDPVFTLRQGATPLLLSIPHMAIQIPSWLQPRLTARALACEDADWHLDRLYAFANDLGASVLTPRYARYLIDLNRPPDNAPMYPGAANTELCPTRFFTGEPLYRDGQAPDQDEIGQRTAQYWQPYHQALRQELDRLRQRFGYALLFDAHSICSRLPWLFDGTLPDLNLGTSAGLSCDTSITAALAEVVATSAPYSHAINGRFKGGYITREYGAPQQRVHAVQLELCWSTYMIEQAPWSLDESRAAAIAPVLERLLRQFIDCGARLHR